MKIYEIQSGSLPKSNISKFQDPKHACDIDGYQVMAETQSGYYIFGILNPDNTPKSYIIIEPEQNGSHKLREIYTDPKFRGHNLAATLLLALKGKLDIKLLLSKDEIISQDARNLILKMVSNNRLHPTRPDGTKISTDELKNIFNTIGETNDEIILEGSNFMSWEKRYRKDEVLSERWRLRDSKDELYD